MFGDGTGGLSILSLKDPEHPLFVGAVRATDLLQPADSHGPADTATRYYEGENMTVDSRRKLVFLARDPRSFGNNSHPNGRTGLYIVDVKDPWHPTILSYHWVPAGHTATCINDCRYVWSMGPANNGSHVNGQPQDIAGVLHPEWTGVPVFVTDVRDPLHPYTYAQPVDMKRNNNTHRVHAQRRRRPARRSRGRRASAACAASTPRAATGIRCWTSTAGRPRPTRSRTRAAASLERPELRDEHPRAQLVPRDPGARATTSSPTVTAADGRMFNKADLQYVTQENVTSCTSTSGGGSGRFVVANLAGSYNGEDWDPALERVEPVLHRDDRRLLGQGLARRDPGGSCSAHWFTVLGDMVAIAFYGQGTRILDMSDPTEADPGRLHPHPVGHGPVGQQHLGRVLAQRLHLHRRLQPRSRRPEVHGRDQGRRPAQGLLERLRPVGPLGGTPRARRSRRPAVGRFSS